MIDTTLAKKMISRSQRRPSKKRHCKSCSNEKQKKNPDIKQNKKGKEIISQYRIIGVLKSNKEFELNFTLFE